MVTVILEQKLRERLRAAITLPSARHNEWQVAVLETVRFYYPDLNEKQLSVCADVVHMLWDLDGLRPMDQLIYRRLNPSRCEYRLFSSKEEVLQTIAELKKKKVLWEKVTIWDITPPKKKTVSVRKIIVGFVKKEIEDQALEAMKEANVNGCMAFI